MTQEDDIQQGALNFILTHMKNGGNLEQLIDENVSSLEVPKNQPEPKTMTNEELYDIQNQFTILHKQLSKKYPHIDIQTLEFGRTVLFSKTTSDRFIDTVCFLKKYQIK